MSSRTKRRRDSAASSRSAGRSYADALRDAATGASRWYCDQPPDEAVLGLTVQDASERIQEIHQLAYHLICDAVERHFAGGRSS